MATTGFWPVKGKLKDVIEYARNPDKTTDPKCLDDDLYKALRYTQNDEKTDKAMYVDAINCPKKRAYEQMMTTKRRFGKMGGNVAYHGFQSFKSGEVTPAEAHAIGMETARRMWGDEYEIVVITHLNTDNLHNHMVMNSVSFKTGRKFENHISDHYRLREISDAVCIEHGKSVLKDAPFYGGEKGAYWIHKSGGLTHRDILKRDIESVLQYSRKPEDFQRRLKALGYQFIRGDDKYQHLSVKAPDWKRPIRLDSLGYTREVINARFESHWKDEFFYIKMNNHPQYRPKRFPLLEYEKQLEFEIDHSHDAAVVLVDVIFYILLQLLLLIKDQKAQEQRCQALSPSMRMEVTKLHQIEKEYLLLADNDIHSAEELFSFKDDVSSQIKTLESERQQYRNLIRRPKPPEVESDLKQKCKDLSEKINPLRDKLHTAESIVERYPKLQELLKTEHQMEKDALIKERERGR
ncbi:MAG: relaxase/mobilization nuclease domain-containing protein [Eubacteriales bacterium]|nr:relaxase/mobilization nuclease domain-containing protein [Eubacteriales bacterium]